MLMSYKGVNSSRVLFYLGKKFWEGHTTDIDSQVFHAHLNFLERKIQEGNMCRDLADQRDVYYYYYFFYLAVISYANSTCKVKTGEDADDRRALKISFTA